MTTSQDSTLEQQVNDLKVKLIYARNFTPHKVDYYEEELKRLASKLIWKDGEDTWYLTYIDNTHFYLSNSQEYIGSAFHVGQFRDRISFYPVLTAWLKLTSQITI